MVESGSEIAELQRLTPSEWSDYLDRRSGLPGSRANLALVAGAATVAGQPEFDAMLDSGGEYQAMCAAAAAGRRSADPVWAARARSLAADERWRVREGVAIGLQLLGDSDFEVLAALAQTWAEDNDPLVLRAALAAVCEPRLLGSPAAAAVALEVCRRTTERLSAIVPEQRKRPDVRTLRQSLAYCWSVAVAADPERGLPLFVALDSEDPDVAWIVAQNRRKKRLAKLL